MAPQGFPVLKGGASVCRQVQVQAIRHAADLQRRLGHACKQHPGGDAKKKRREEEQGNSAEDTFPPGRGESSGLSAGGEELSIAVSNPVESVSTSTCSVSTFRMILPK